MDTTGIKEIGKRREVRNKTHGIGWKMSNMIRHLLDICCGICVGLLLVLAPPSLFHSQPTLREYPYFGFGTAKSGVFGSEIQFLYRSYNLFLQSSSTRRIWMLSLWTKTILKIRFQTTWRTLPITNWLEAFLFLIPSQICIAENT